MDITLPIPQTIGTNFGAKSDGVIIGSVAHLEPSAMKYYTKTHQINYAVQSATFSSIPETVVWTELQDSFNNSIAVAPYDPPAAPGPGPITATSIPYMYYAVRETITGFTFNVSTPIAGTDIIFVAEYSTATGYSTLTSATYSPDFYTVSGLSTITFTPPTDWVATNIGANVPKEKWLRLRILDGATISTQLEITGGWEVTGVIEESEDGTANPPFFNPYNNLLPQTGDGLFISSSSIPYCAILTYTNPFTDGTVNYKYSKVDGTFGDLTPLSDTSNGLTASNSQTFARYSLASTGAFAYTNSNVACAADCIVSGTIVVAPTATTNRFSIGFISANIADTPEFQLSATFEGSAPVYKKIIDGDATTITGVTPTAGDVMEIYRINGEIYFFVNGVNIDSASTPPTSTGNLYAAFIADDDATDIYNVIFTDWTDRMSVPLAITFSNVTNFTSLSASHTQNFPGHYYMTFIPPVDFASLTVPLSKTGVAGYEIELETEITSLTVPTPMVLQDVKLMTADSSENEFFPTGTQSILRLMNLDMADSSNFTESTTFLLVLRNSAGYSYRSVTLPAANGANILSAAINQIGMTGVIVSQLDGLDSVNIGTPSFIYLAT